MRDFKVLEKIHTKKFSINGIVYNTADVYEGRFTEVLKDCQIQGKWHVRWNKPQKAYCDEYGNSVNVNNDIQARECLCSGFLFNKEDISYIED